MENDDFDWDDYIHTAGMGPRLLPVQATELLGGIGSRILRSLLVAAPDDIPEAYACSPEEAAVALACCELAELSVWDEAALIEAATVGGSEEQRLMWGCESRDRLARRISLSMKAEKAPEVMSPADGVLLLHRAGIHVFHQLLDVVAVMTIRQYTPESQSLYRQLKGIAEPQQTAPATDTAPPEPVMQATEIRERRQDRRLKACIDAGLCFEGYKGRLPDGVGDAADREGIKRQSFSADVKAALTRRDNAKREGVTVRRA